MHLVDHAELFPGCCILTGTGDGPFLDLLGQNEIGERRYVSVAFVQDMAAAIGMLSPQAAGAYEEQLDATQRELDKLQGVQQELHELKRSVRRTLNAGAVQVRENVVETHKLRPLPGEKAVAL